MWLVKFIDSQGDRRKWVIFPTVTGGMHRSWFNSTYSPHTFTLIMIRKENIEININKLHRVEISPNSDTYWGRDKYLWHVNDLWGHPKRLGVANGCKLLPIVVENMILYIERCILSPLVPHSNLMHPTTNLRFMRI